MERSSGGGGDPPAAVPNSNYVVPMDSNLSSCITRPLAEILRDLNKRIPDNIITKTHEDLINTSTPFIPWFEFILIFLEFFLNIYDMSFSAII